jgi:hypothetical protein
MDSTQNPIVENHKSFRCRVPRENQSAELRVGDHSMQISLTDESADGFAALTTSDPTVDRGTLARLHTHNGDYEVQVAYVRAMGVVSIRDSGDPQNLYRIGLQRLRDIPRSDDLETDPKAKKAGVGGWFSIGWKALVLIDILAALLALGLVEVPRGSVPLLDTVRDWLPWPDAPHSPAKDEHKPAELASSTPDRAGHAERAIAQAAAELRKVVFETPGAGVFTTPSVARELRLNDAQLAAINRIIESANRSAPRQETSAQRFARLYESTRQQALSLLTPEQHERWDLLNRPTP